MKLLLPFACFAGVLVPNLQAQGTRCPVTPYGRTCGPLFSGRVELDGQNRRLELRLVNAFPNMPGFSILGTQRLGVLIPGTQCYLNTDIVVAVPFATNAAGTAVHTALVPYSASLQVLAQDVVLRGAAIQSSNGLSIGPWQPVRHVEEDFRTVANRDPRLSGASWGNGLLQPGLLGGSGVLGEFRASDGKDLRQKDAKGRDIYEWNTDNMVIPASRTLTGQAITVTNGVFEFTTLIVKANEHVRFVGNNVPRLQAAGIIQIDGAISLPVPKPPTKSNDPRRGIPGGKGGPGANSGGQGGDAPTFSGGSIHGRPGGDVLVPKGHPRAGQAAGTGGGGASAHPKSGLAKDLAWVIDTGTKLFVSGTAAGGGGGGLYTAGLGGKAEYTITRRPFWPFFKGELGPPSQGGKAFPVLPLVTTKASTDLLLIGGSGGGGGGMHAFYTIDERNIAWSPGAGGAGGGGVLSLRAGGDLIVGDKAQVLVKGGDSNDQPISNNRPPVHAAGGAGSGGTVLAQCGGIPSIAGEVNVLGGKGGKLFEKTLLYMSSVGGDGGAGYIRVEADPPPLHTNFPKMQPPATKNNVGLLRSLDHDPVTAGASLWYVTGFLPTAYHYYEIRAKVDGKAVVFSDNPLISSTKAVTGQPVVFYIQSANVDTSRQPITPPTRWVEGVVDPLNDDPRRGNGFRFLIFFDRTKTSSGRIEVSSAKVFFNC